MRILCFGSLNLDNVYQVDHHVRSGETLASICLKQFPGGKGLNQSIALARAGANVWHAGQIGSDGYELRTLLENNHVNCEFIGCSEERTGHAIIQVDRTGQNCILLYGGANRCIRPEWVEQVLSHFEAGDILLLQNEVNGLAHLMKTAHEKGMQIAFNPSPMDQEIFSLPLKFVRWFLLNEIEGKEFTGSTCPHEIGQRMLQSYPNAEIILTLGEKGGWYQSKDQALSFPSYQVDVVDTTAAGDTFTGYFLAEIAKGKSIDFALDCASKAAALAVSKEGAAPSIPLLEEVENSDLPIKICAEK